MKIKIKEAYLLVLIVTGLMFTAIYSTYALFTKEVTLDNVVSFNTTISLSDSNLIEYELVTLNPNETKIIELSVSNSSTSSLYYGCWYELLTTNNNVSVGVYTEKNSTLASGTLDTSATKTILLGVVNNSTSSTLVNIGVVGSTTENLGLSNSRTVVTDTYSPYILVTDEVLAANTTTTTTETTENVTQSFTEVKSYEITLGKGAHTLEVWGAQGGAYNSYVGGKGGYSKGTLTLTEETTAFVYVGGYPGTAKTAGFNGGSGTNNYGGGGGGASDIRLGTDSLYARVIVAGGGGGAGYRSATGGAGGGTSGVAGSGTGTYAHGGGGTQTSGGTSANTSGAGTFGTGGGSTSISGGGGGGGWYGGGHGQSGSQDSAGGGGSGYVYTADTASNCPSGCLLNSSYYLTNAATYAGNTSFTDYSGSTATGHSGNGAIKITGPKVTPTTVTTYQIPRILGLTPLKVKVGTSKNLETGVTYECETGSSFCTYLGSEITDTSTLGLGTHTVKYKIKGTNNKTYVYERTIYVVDDLRIDNSGANYPELTDALIPVVYNGSNWVKADVTSSTSTYGWYDYDQKKWANAVLVTDTNRSTYQSASAGTTIADADILAFYVWIPRYKYKVWNINKVIGTDSYNAQTTGIDIVFEDGTSSTGTISCTYSYTAPSSTAGSPNETCTGSNGDFYTHPAFTFGNQELTGFWMGKFELSSSNPATGSSYGGGNTTSLTPRILPNVTSWRNNTVSNYWKVIYDMQTSNNTYGLPTSRTNADSHMITNMEWGAVAYLTNSKYGRCTNGSCTEVSMNGYGEKSNYTTMTGCGPISSRSTSYGTTCNAYNTTLGQTASTTGNITGVYDMSGGSNEYVMGNISKSNGTSYTYYASGAGTNFTYSTNTAKYLIPYAYGTTYNDQTAYNRGRLGDATSEVVKSSRGIEGWYDDYALFPCSSSSWFRRGGDFMSSITAGPFYFDSNAGTSNRYYSSRVALLVLL